MAGSQKSKSKSDKYEDEGIETPAETDVLCGRGGMSNHHPGNEWYRRLIKSNRPLYRACPKHTKLLVSKAIVQAVQQQGGRFLEKNKKSALWFPVPYKRAVDKTSQGLRERERDDEGKNDLTESNFPEQFSGKVDATLADLADVAIAQAEATGLPRSASDLPKPELPEINMIAPPPPKKPRLETAPAPAQPPYHPAAAHPNVPPPLYPGHHYPYPPAPGYYAGHPTVPPPPAMQARHSSMYRLLRQPELLTGNSAWGNIAPKNQQNGSTKQSPSSAPPPAPTAPAPSPTTATPPPAPGYPPPGYPPAPPMTQLTHGVTSTLMMYPPHLSSVPTGPHHYPPGPHPYPPKPYLYPAPPRPGAQHTKPPQPQPAKTPVPPQPAPNEATGTTQSTSATQKSPSPSTAIPHTTTRPPAVQTLTTKAQGGAPKPVGGSDESQEGSSDPIVGIQPYPNGAFAYPPGVNPPRETRPPTPSANGQPPPPLTRMATQMSDWLETFWPVQSPMMVMGYPPPPPGLLSHPTPYSDAQIVPRKRKRKKKDPPTKANQTKPINPMESEITTVPPPPPTEPVKITTVPPPIPDKDDLLSDEKGYSDQGEAEHEVEPTDLEKSVSTTLLNLAAAPSKLMAGLSSFLGGTPTRLIRTDTEEAAAIPPPPPSRVAAGRVSKDSLLDDHEETADEARLRAVPPVRKWGQP